MSGDERIDEGGNGNRDEEVREEMDKVGGRLGGERSVVGLFVKGESGLSVRGLGRGRECCVGMRGGRRGVGSGVGGVGGGSGWGGCRSGGGW